MRLKPGDVVDDKYEIVRLLGRGGMGAVYEGTHRRIHRRVALKVLHSAISTDDVIVTRFEREAQAAGRIGSEHIVEVLDLGQLPTGERYMVMEYLDGESLHDRLRRDGQLLPETCFPIAVELLTGLEAAHAAGIVHRDLKPENIWLLPAHHGRGDFVKILDFGVSKFRLKGTADVTHTGIVVGTPAYMAPEQATADRDVDHRADLYVVGVILFRCLTGQVPYEGATYNELMYKLAIEEPPELSSVLPEVDAEVSAIVARATRRERDERYPDASAFRVDLERWLQRNGFPVSLAVAGLLQSGDHIAASLLQSGDRLSASHDGRLGDDTETMPPADHHAPARWDDDSQTAVRPFSQASSELPRPSRLDADQTTAIAEEDLAAMSLEDLLESGTRRLADEDPTIPRPVHIPAPPRVPAVSQPQPRTVPLVFAGLTLLIGLVAGVGVATLASEEGRHLHSHAAEIQRLASEAERATRPRARP